MAEGKQWTCMFCGYTYDENAGCSESGIVPGTSWEEIPDDWCCPICGAEKADFQPEDAG